MQAGSSEPVAIVGIGCRFPGGANTPQRFWDLLLRGVDTIREVPPDRFDIEALYSPEPKAPGRLASRYGAFLDTIDEFDADFFRISSREAPFMDPQHRLLLECAVEAVEDAGIPLPQLVGTNAAVFVGSFNNDYETRMYHRLPRLDLYSVSGGGRFSMANRVSYALDVRGASTQVDTACSSSLVALELACKALRSGECDFALVGGTNLVINPWLSMCLSTSGVLARSGRCQFGSAKRDGYIRADSVAMIGLRPLSVALREGNPIYALVHAAGSNNDGASSGSLVHPGIETQRDLMLRMWRQAGIGPDDIQYIEAHGTGTPVGDAVEMAALGAALARGERRKHPCWVGSVKTNIGHGEGGSGMASVIKTALCLQHRMIPPSLHGHPLDPKIPWERLQIRIVDTITPWPDHDRPRCAGVNSFGMTGTNAHAVLGEAPAERTWPKASRKWFFLPITASTPEALEARTKDVAEFLDEQAVDQTTLYEVCRTASHHRAHFAERVVVAGRSRDELSAQLRALRLTTTYPREQRQESALKTAFVFSGQGAQWPTMGMVLFQTEPVFQDALEEVDALWRQIAPDSLIDAIKQPEATSRLMETRLAQPTIFATQVGLVRLLASWGIRPDAVVGHSVGEIAAAHAAGIIDLAPAVQLVERRATHMQSDHGRGAMVSLNASADEIAPQLPRSLTIAAYNDPRSTIISGPADDVAAFRRHMATQGIENLPVRVAFAFHSPAMALAANALEHDLVQLPAPHPAMLDIYSTVDGAHATSNAFDAAYWGKNVREPVRFVQAIDAMKQDGVNLFIEIAPHAVLARSIQRTLGDKLHHRVVSTLYRGRDDVLMMGTLVDHLFRLHYPLHWSRINSAPTRCLRLPPYPFQRKLYWIDESSAPSVADTSSRSTTVAPRRETPTTTVVETPPAPRTSHDILDFLLTMTGRVFAIERRDIRPDLEIAKLAPDSLAFLEFMSQIEQTFGKRLSMQTIRDHARTLGDLAKLVIHPVQPSVLRKDSSASSADQAQEARVLRSYERAFADLPIERKILRIDAHDVETFTMGHGPPLVVLPAWQAMATAWAPLMKQLGHEHEIVSLHYPGYGLSTGPLLDVEGLVTLVEAVLQRLDLYSVDLIGWSLGGLLAQKLALRRPLRSLMLVNTTGCLGTHDSATEMHGLMTELHADFERSTAMIGEEEAQRTALFDSIRATDDPNVFLHYAGMILRYDNRSQLHQITTPTVVIAGERDGITTVEHGQALANAIPGAHFRLLPNAGHYIPLLHPAWLVEQRQTCLAHSSEVVPTRP